MGPGGQQPPTSSLSRCLHPMGSRIGLNRKPRGSHNHGADVGSRPAPEKQSSNHNNCSFCSSRSKTPFCDNPHLIRHFDSPRSKLINHLRGWSTGRSIYICILEIDRQQIWQLQQNTDVFNGIAPKPRYSSFFSPTRSLMLLMLLSTI